MEAGAIPPPDLRHGEDGDEEESPQARLAGSDRRRGSSCRNCLIRAKPEI
jgi:hypothetical protein